jgi:hypothetical protein
MASLIQNEDVTVVNSSVPECVLQPPTRQIMEAKRIMQLQEDVGMVIFENKEEHVQRIMELEERDQKEKEGRELNREIVGSQ